MTIYIFIELYGSDKHFNFKHRPYSSVDVNSDQKLRNHCSLVNNVPQSMFATFDDNLDHDKTCLHSNKNNYKRQLKHGWILCNLEWKILFWEVLVIWFELKVDEQMYHTFIYFSSAFLAKYSPLGDHKTHTVTHTPIILTQACDHRDRGKWIGLKLLPELLSLPTWTALVLQISRSADTWNDSNSWMTFYIL